MLLITNKIGFLRVRSCSRVIFPHPVLFQEFHFITFGPFWKAATLTTIPPTPLLWPLLREAGPHGLGLTAGLFHRSPHVSFRVVCGPFLSALSPGASFQQLQELRQLLQKHSSSARLRTHLASVYWQLPTCPSLPWTRGEWMPP